MSEIQPLATLEDYESAYGAVSESDQSRVKTLLLRATGKVLNALGSYTAGDDALLDLNAQTVVCEMVHRAMATGLGLEGVSQAQQTAGSLSASLSFANPDNALYLSSQNREDLGLLGCSVSLVGMGAEDAS